MGKCVNRFEGMRLRRDKDLRKILDELMEYLELREKNQHEQVSEKLWQVIEMMMTFHEIQENFTRRDLQDRLGGIATYLGKWIHAITRDDLSAYVREMFEKTNTYRFFFPAPELRGFPEGFEVGCAKLFPFSKLPDDVKEYISMDWKYQYEIEKKPYRQTLEEYVKQRNEEPYFSLEVIAFGPDKAILTASERANKSLNVLKSIYHSPLSPLRECA